MTDSDEVKLLPCPHTIALSSLYWADNPELVRATEALREDGYNNAKGHLSSYMAGRFLDAYQAARAAIEATRPPVVTDEVVERVALRKRIARAIFGDDRNFYAMPESYHEMSLYKAADRVIAALASMPAVVSGGQGEREFLLLASYCGNDNPACTEGRPCADCLSMCNVFDARNTYLRQLGLPAQPGIGK